nr:hypothetical protein yagA [Bradyrhizobium sp. DOA9]
MVIEARQEFVRLANAPGANIRALCRQFEVSPKTAYKFLTRVRMMGPPGLQDLSRRPLHNPTKIFWRGRECRHVHPSRSSAVGRKAHCR